ncbi:MAG: helix-turn-helix transcriptional regulator [Tistlia sp.]|uniref:helix-turn-helix transcriptional regulator n=1 Tax=Tistlia sp. TaxID=3057121 RepID=UPI0034A4DD39
MTEEEDAEFSRTIAALYEASAAPDLWPAAAAAMALYCGADAAQFIQVHAHSPVQVLSYAGGPGHSPAAEKAYVDYYWRIDPRQRHMDRAPGRLFLCHEVFDEAFVRTSEFYNDFSIPHGFRWIIGGQLVSTGDAKLQLALLRSTGRPHFTRRELDRAGRVVPHLARAARLGHGFLEAQHRSGVAQAVLDSLPWAVAVVAASLKVLAANAMAAALMETGRLPLRGGRLSMPDPATEARLRELVGDAIRTAERRGGRGGGALALDRSDAPPCRLFVSPLPPQAEAGLIAPRSGDGCALIAVQQADARARPTARALMDLFGLTQAEARVALELAEGQRLGEIAERRGLSPNTLRSQVKAILAKTGCHGQADLLQRLASMPSL